MLGRIGFSAVEGFGDVGPTNISMSILVREYYGTAVIISRRDLYGIFPRLIATISTGNIYWWRLARTALPRLSFAARPIPLKIRNI
jgi:hypothetical protein